jgi:hypothetical protein
MKARLKPGTGRARLRMRIHRTLLRAALTIAAAPAAALAAPLDPEACAALKTEHASLVAAGAKSDMSRGPAWAKANLAPERLGRIERLITVEEQLSFRCGELLTARPQMKEPPQPAAGVSSNIPPPKRKSVSAALAAKNRQQAARP